MGKKFSTFNLTSDQRRWIEGLGSSHGWSLQPRLVLDPILPTLYVSQIDSVVSVAVPTSSGGTCRMFNSLRIDTNAGMIDQDPLAFFQNSTGLTAVGVLRHHGSWDWRSWPMSAGLQQYVSEHGVGGYFLSNPPRNRRSGSIDDLPAGSAGAVIASLDLLRSL